MSCILNQSINIFAALVYHNITGLDLNLVILIVGISIAFKTAILIFRFKVPKSKGAVGEYRVAKRLKKLKGKYYRVLNDVLFYTQRGSSQVDHIVVSTHGIFVIETKNFSGWISGHENSEYWTQSIYGNKTKFRNPIKQNWSHVLALKKLLSDYQAVNYHPIVVFSDKAELMNVSATSSVIYEHQLIQTIEDITSKAQLSAETVESISGMLNEVNVQDKTARKEHAYQVKRQIYNRKLKEELKICPRCGEDLVLRDGKFGKFYGCSGYPKCRYKLNYSA